MSWMAKAFALVVVVVTVALTQPVTAPAQTLLDQYRKDGVIAERYDGYLELRGAGAPAGAVNLVRDVNEQRREIYEKRAKEENVPVEAVGKLFAKKLAEQGAPAGTYFKMPDGTYQRK